MSRSKRDGTEPKDKEGFNKLIDESEKIFNNFLYEARWQHQYDTIVSGVRARKLSAEMTKIMLAFRLKSSIYTPNNRDQRNLMKTAKRPRGKPLGMNHKRKGKEK